MVVVGLTMFTFLFMEKKKKSGGIAQEEIDCNVLKGEVDLGADLDINEVVYLFKQKNARLALQPQLKEIIEDNPSEGFIFSYNKGDRLINEMVERTMWLEDGKIYITEHQNLHILRLFEFSNPESSDCSVTRFQLRYYTTVLKSEINDVNPM